MASKKTYVAIAAEFASVKRTGGDDGTLLDLACRVGRIFEADNPNFDFHRFTAACGFNTSEDDDEDVRPTRYALVTGARDAAQVAAYLPGNYSVSEDALDPRDGIVIEGYDHAGWTLDDYVIPRLASGNIAAKEQFLHLEDVGGPENGPQISRWLSDEPQTNDLYRSAHYNTAGEGVGPDCLNCNLGPDFHDEDGLCPPVETRVGR